MGSGHILVYAFDVLMQIYTSYGYTQRDAAKSILQNNLYGIDIDTRAYQLAYFAVMMKARQYNRRIFNEGILPNLMAVKNPAPCTDSCLKRLGDLEKLGRRLITDFKDAEEYGSILQLNYTKTELDALDARLDDIDKMADYGNLLVQMESIECVNTLAPLVRQARIMSQKYDVVVTNPPYMGITNGTAKVIEYVKKHYPDNKIDLFSVFMEKTIEMLKANRFCSLITQQTWMFISSFIKTRNMLRSYSVTSVNHLGTRAFEEISGEVVQSAAYSLRKTNLHRYVAAFVKLDDTEDKENGFIEQKRRYNRSLSSFDSLPDNIFAYLAFWASTEISAFSMALSLASEYSPSPTAPRVCSAKLQANPSSCSTSVGSVG